VSGGFLWHKGDCVPEGLVIEDATHNTSAVEGSTSTKWGDQDAVVGDLILNTLMPHADVRVRDVIALEEGCGLRRADP